MSLDCGNLGKLLDIYIYYGKTRLSAYAKTKTQISCAVTAQLMSRLCFHCMDSATPLLLVSGISSFCLSSVTAQPDCVIFRHKPTCTVTALNFGCKKKLGCTISVAKTKVLISCGVTAQLICAFVFALAKIWFSHDAAQIQIVCKTYC